MNRIDYGNVDLYTFIVVDDKGDKFFKE